MDTLGLTLLRLGSGSWRRRNGCGAVGRDIPSLQQTAAADHAGRKSMTADAQADP